jgi:hypothetical protein
MALIPGACAPGFMLARAPRADSDSCWRARASALLVRLGGGAAHSFYSRDGKPDHTVLRQSRVRYYASGLNCDWGVDSDVTVGAIA